MKYIFDTNVISTLILEEENGLISSKLRQLSQYDEVCISVLTLYEETYGLENANDEARENRFQNNINFIKKYFTIIPLDLKEAEIYAQLKVAYKNYTGINKKSMKKNDMDILIASTAIAHNAILISSDRIFELISRLDSRLWWEDWTSC
ncbi:MAG: hypothetical protein CR967_01485 [Proteobacteria bacterium]|nr:MAG: hypothetical protein CR967_01485 [Pseudomonadota bacterium]